MISPVQGEELFQGLAAVAWSAGAGEGADRAFFQGLLARRGGLALELGCGTGRLLLSCLRAGLAVEGCDLSADMLALCRRDAERLGLAPVLYHQAMQELALPRRYRTILIPCGSLKYVLGRPAVVETLRRCRAHLEPAGLLAFNLYLPTEESIPGWTGRQFPTPWRLRVERDLDAGGGRLAVRQRTTAIDQAAHRVTEERRYDLYAGSRLRQRQSLRGQFHWYEKAEVLELLAAAGFGAVTVQGDYTGEELAAHHGEAMVFLATCP